MILSRAEIDRRVAAGSITISPYCAEQLNPTSYSYRLGTEISELSSTDPAAGRAHAVVEDRLAQAMIGAWKGGQTSLRRPLA